MDIKKQIAELQKKGFTKSQAGIIALQQGGRILNDSQVVDLNKNKSFAGLEVVPEFGKSGYFITEEQQRQQEAVKLAQEQMLRAQQLSNITDITSDGQFTNRKVWHTQKPEWFVGKQQPIEGKDYTVVPYNQWGAYQTSPAYSTYMNKGKLAGMQQGGYYNNYNPYFTENPGFNSNVPQQPNPFSEYAIPSNTINIPSQQQSLTTPTSYTNNSGENYVNRNPLPNFGNNSFQYNPNVVDTTPITTNIQPQINPLAVDAGSGVSSYQEPTYNQNFNNFGGGYSLENSLRMFGQGLGEQDPSKTAMGGTLSALKLGRIGIGGYASGKENRRVEDEYRRKLYEDNRLTTNLQEGGEIKNSEVLTGQFAVANPNGGNVIIEDSEYLKNNETGQIQKAIGEDHKNGGIPINLQDGKVLSDFTKIGAKNAKELKDRYNLSLKKTDTFAKVMDKVNKKIGIDKLAEEQAKAIEKLGNNEYIKDQTTKTLNEKLLTKEVEESQAKLDTLKGTQNFAFEDIFALQESVPKKGNGELINPDGSPMEVKGQETPAYQQGGHIYELAKKHGISSERAMELCQQGGAQTPQEEQIEGQASNPQEEQGEISPEQIIQAYSQLSGQDPQVIVQQLQQLSPEQQQQALQQMVASLQQGQQSPQEEQAEGQMSNPVEEGQEMAQQGGGYSFSTRYLPKAKDYVTEGSSILNQDVLSGVEEFQPFTGKGYGAKMADVAKTIDTHSWYFDTDKKKKDFTEAVLKKGKQPEVVAFQEAYNKELEKRAKSAGVPQTEIDNIKKEVGFSDKGVQNVDGLFGAFTSTRPLYNFSKNNGEVVARPEFNQGQMVENIAPTYQDNTVGFQPYITPPSSRKGVILETVQSPQYDRVKRTFEAGENAIASQADTKRQQVLATGLAPQIQEAIMAGDLATSQGASNQNIASVEQFNAQNAQQVNQLQENADFKTNLFNLGQRDQYFVRNTAAQDNFEIAQKMYNDLYNKLGYTQQNDLMNRNLVNATSNNYSINADGTVTFKAPQSQFIAPENTEYYNWYNALPATQQEAERRRLAKETLDRANAMKKENTSKVRKF